MNTPAKLPEEKKATEYLANERTFLAWIRTCVALISLGFLVAKFSLWLRVLTPRSAPGTLPHTGTSLPIGIGMMAFGAVLALLAFGRYRSVNRAIAEGRVTPDHWLIVLVTACVVIIGLIMMAAMVLSASRL